MAKLVYVANVSLDGYIEDAQGSFGWTEPPDDVFTFITDLLRPMGTHLYGRRLYETMAAWELDPDLAAGSELMADFARTWQAADKVVYSTTLQTVPTHRTRLERRFDPDAVRELKASAAGDVVIGGATSAARAFDAGHHLIYPMLVGAGKPAFCGRAPVQMTLVEEQRFDSGVVYLRYRIMS
jgi:dihydrofolate reductase